MILICFRYVSAPASFALLGDKLWALRKCSEEQKRRRIFVRQSRCNGQLMRTAAMVQQAPEGQATDYTGLCTKSWASQMPRPHFTDEWQAESLGRVLACPIAVRAAIRFLVLRPAQNAMPSNDTCS
jgi:hypothetical protein